MPELFAALRGLIDAGRRRGKVAGRFLLLGSASPDLLRQSETLAGRIAYIELSPLHVLEIPDGRQSDLWERGGFPESFLGSDASRSLIWRQDFIRTYLERDIPQLGPRIPAHPVAGGSWKGFVVENLIAAAPVRSVPLFYRTAVGAEIDLLLEIPGHGLWAVEVKRGLSARPEKGFYIACEDVKPTRSFVVNSGSERYAIGKGVDAMSLKEMASTLAAL